MHAGYIESAHNPHFRMLRSLLHARGIKRHSLALISGRKIVPETSVRVREVILDASRREEHVAVAEARQISSRRILAPGLFSQLDVLGTRFPLLLVEVPRLPEFVTPRSGLNVFLALSDPANLGAALRTLTAFRATQVVLLREACHPFLPKVTKTAAGANYLAPLAKGPGIHELRVAGLHRLDLHGTPLETFRWPRVSCLLLGEEGGGIPENLKKSSVALAIEMAPEVESLSAPVALAIAAHDHRLQVGADLSKLRKA